MFDGPACLPPPPDWGSGRISRFRGNLLRSKRLAVCIKPRDAVRNCSEFETIKLRLPRRILILPLPRSSHMSMNQKDLDDLDTWLFEVDLASKKIKELASGNANVDEFDKEEMARLRKKDAEKKRKEQAEEEKRLEKEQSIKSGRHGKGEQNNYASFCRACHWEYELPTPECMRCKRSTVDFTTRYAELTVKVEEFKKTKTKRQERKMKWELWKKTQAMMWKKTSVNYSKWDVYTSDSDSDKEEPEPVVPKNDPNFKALEMDINQRKIKREKDSKFAEACKIKGNEAMVKEDYKLAVKHYSEGLDAYKDNKALWTNRALAFIKIKKYAKAIEDCTRILDYCECFEEGYKKSSDFAFKALLRRSLARKEKKDYIFAKEDIEQALALYPKDQHAIDLKKEIEFIINHKAQATELLQQQNEERKKRQADEAAEDDDKQKAAEDATLEPEEQPTEGGVAAVPVATTTEPTAISSSIKYKGDFQGYIDAFMEKSAGDVSEDEVKQLAEILASEGKAKIYFFERRGTARMENLLKAKKGSVYLLANIFLDDNVLFQDQFIKNECHCLVYSHIEELLLQQSSSQAAVLLVEEAFEVLIALSTLDGTRAKLAAMPVTAKFISNVWAKILATAIEEPQQASTFLIYVSNLCYGATLVKKHLLEQTSQVLTDLHRILMEESRRGVIERLRENSYNLIANMLTEEPVRKAFSEDKYSQIIEAVALRIARYDLEANPKFTAAAEAALALLVNASFKAAEPMQAILSRSSVGLIIIGRFFKLNWRKPVYNEIFSRSLQILAKLDYSKTPSVVERLFEYVDMLGDDRFAGHVIRLYANLATNPEAIEVIKKSPRIDFKAIIAHIKTFIASDAETNFCNACNLAQYFNDCKPELLAAYTDVIPRLIDVCGNKIGNYRKNAAIFLAKLAKNADNLARIRELHGIEILHSILPQVVSK